MAVILATAAIVPAGGAQAAAALAGYGSGHVAAAHPGGRATQKKRRQPAAGTISTLAGGPGGPEDATNVALNAPCGVASGPDGQVYAAEPGPTAGPVITGPNQPHPSAAGIYPSGSGAVQQMAPGSGVATPYAGTYALRGPAVNGGPATSASLSTCGVAEDHSGNLVIADHQTCRIRVVAATTGTFYDQAMTAGDIYTIAGDGSCKFFGNSGKALRAGMDPVAVQVDAAGNLVILDHDRVRVVAESTATFYGIAMTAGHIYTIVGDGTAKFSGDGGPATAATLDQPTGLAVDGAGNAVISDTGDCRIRVVAATTGTYYGQAMTGGDISTIAGDGSCAFSGDGGPAASAGLMPEGLAVDAAGNLVVADKGNDRVRVLAAATGTYYGQAMTGGDIYTIAGTGTAGFSGDGGPAAGATLRGPKGVAVDADGNVVVADTGNDRVRVLAGATGTYYGQAMTGGDIYTVAGTGNVGFSGDGGPLAAAEFHNPGSLAVDAGGDLAVIDFWDNRVRFVPAATGTYFGQAMTGGDIYTIAGNGQDGADSHATGVPATNVALNDPAQVAVDSSGNLVIADSEDCLVRLVADTNGTFYGVAMTAGYVYTIAGDGHTKNGCAFTGDGSVATSTGMHPQGVAVDASGNLVIADNWSCQILVLAATTGIYYGQAMTAGDVYDVAGDGSCGYSGDGGPATGAELYFGPDMIGRNIPFGVAVDAAGNLVIPDSDNNRVRVVAAATGIFYGQAMIAGDVYTIAGDGTAGYSGDGGPGAAAELDYPTIVTTDAAGNVIIADSGNDRVRVVAGNDGTFYGQAMTADDIYTVAGDGTIGFSGDGGPGADAELSGPDGLAVDAGNLLISDGDGNARIREMPG